MTNNQILRETLNRIAETLRRGGASLPAPKNKGTIESAMVGGLSIALCVVENEIEALAATATSDSDSTDAALTTYRATLCRIGIVGKINEKDAIYRDSAIEMLDRAIAAPKKESP